MSHFCSYFVCYCLLFKQKDYELSDVLIGDFSRSEQNIYWLSEWCRTLAGTFGMFEKCPAVIEIHDSSGPLPPFCCQLTNKKTANRAGHKRDCSNFCAICRDTGEVLYEYICIKARVGLQCCLKKFIHPKKIVLKELFSLDV